MKLQPIEELYYDNYSAIPINVLRQYWKNQKTFSCIGVPKEYHHFLFLDGCRAEYTQKDGTVFHANSSDIVYTPSGSEYTLRLYDFESEKSSTVGLNFLLFDSENTPITFSENPCVFHGSLYRPLFRRIEDSGCGARPCFGKMKAGLYDLLSTLSEAHQTERFGHCRMIADGIRYLENDPTLRLTLPELASMCHVSERYFRQLFLEYSGMSVTEYKLNAKINRAKIYLEAQSMTVAEIAEALHFTSSAYFTKQFRKKTGMTPTEYKNPKNSFSP
ncbi:MAG: helix-turn-helix transcriptional regulator [Ruminococcaceae bacterium]|nr:helix-turn-helix transcriptional regulator [Oscillospiraceae bacterium]